MADTPTGHTPRTPQKTEPNRSCSTRARPSRRLTQRGGAGKKAAKMPSKSGTCCRINSSYTPAHPLHMCEREGWSKRPAIMSIHSQKQGYKAKNACGRPSVSVCVCVCVRYSNTRQVYDGLLLQLLLLLLSLLQAPPATLLLTRLSPAAGDAKRQTANGYMTTTCLHFVFCLPSAVFCLSCSYG